MLAAVPFVFVAMLAVVFDWPPTCGTRMMFAAPVMAMALVLAVYWAIWALI